MLYAKTVVIGYAVLLVSVWTLSHHLESELSAFDVNGDGWFSDTEMTPAAERAMEAFTNDTGRTFAPVFGIPLTAIWVFLCFAILYSAEWIAGMLTGPSATLQADADLPTGRFEEFDGNSFQPPNAK